MSVSFVRVVILLLCALSPCATALRLSNRWSGASLKSAAKNAAAFVITQSLLLGSPFIAPSTVHAADASTVAAGDKPVAPLQYGLKKGRLLPCRTESNCVSSSSIKSLEKYGRPWAFTGEPEAEYEALVRLLKSDPYLRLADSDPAARYVRAEAKSAVPPNGVDDVEFLINGADHIITYRSNSRELVRAGVQVVGDAGSNRNRLEGIKRKLGVSEMEMDGETEAYLKETSSLGLLQQMRMMSEPSEINFVDNSVPEKSAATPAAVSSSTAVDTPQS